MGKMATKEACLEHVTLEVEELADKVALLKKKLAQADRREKLRHSWELYVLRERFAEFRRHVRELEDADEDQLDGIRESTEAAWGDLNGMMDAFLNEIC